MENLLTIQPQAKLYNDDSLDLEDFFKDSLEPLMKKFKYRLSQFEHAVVNSERLQNYTLTKVNKAYCLLENLGQEWQERREKALEVRRQILQELDVKILDNASNYYSFMTPPDLVSAMMELSKKYHELDMDNNGEMLDNTIDAFMIKMEELDGKISDALGRADKMRERVEEKLIKVAGVANQHIDKIKYAMSYGTNRLLAYDELPGPWQSNEVNIYCTMLYQLYILTRPFSFFFGVISISAQVIVSWILQQIVGIPCFIFIMKQAIFGHICLVSSSCLVWVFTNCSFPS